MAPPPATPERIDSELRFITLMLRDLPDVVRDWLEMGEAERISWSHDWDQQMGYLRLLDGQYRNGAMTVKQRTRYREPLAKLKASLPTIEQTNLQQPPISLDI